MSFKPFPLFTDGQSVYYTTDGVNFLAISAPTALATPSANGLMSAAQASSLANTSGGLIVAAYESPVIDLTQTSTGNVIVPAVAGKQFILCNRTSIQFRTISSAGSVSTGPTTRVLNGASTWIAAATSPITTSFGGIGAATASPPATPTVNTAVTVDVTVGATGTGGFAWTGVSSRSAITSEESKCGEA